MIALLSFILLLCILSKDSDSSVFAFIGIIGLSIFIVILMIAEPKAIIPIAIFILLMGYALYRLQK
ncbi:MAG: hypothetical protein M0Q12_01085 [Synergistaceae bacterium]|nr:hypothetical protein [Synergistaceae bacterium]